MQTDARTAVAAVAGGTASVLAGGKFANGAITGAFAQMFNAEGGKLIGGAAGGAVGGFLGWLADGDLAGASAGAIIGAARGAKIASDFEDRLLRAKITTGLLVWVDDDGPNAMVFMSSGGRSKDPRFSIYFTSGHVEGQAALYMRANNIGSAILYINNAKGMCGSCYTNLPTLLPRGAVLTTITRSDATGGVGWHTGIITRVGNGRIP